MKINKKSLCFVGFLQATTVFLYCALIGTFLWKGEAIFQPVPNYAAPIFVLVLLVVSVLICGLLTFGYPIYLFWDKKETKEALELVAFTALWLALLVIVLLVIIAIF